jgi:hypothetical protein
VFREGTAELCLLFLLLPLSFAYLNAGYAGIGDQGRRRGVVVVVVVERFQRPAKPREHLSDRRDLRYACFDSKGPIGEYRRVDALCILQSAGSQV